MLFHRAKAMVIITEASILSDITDMITELGALGYTVDSVTGKGERGVRSGDDHSNLFKNVRIDVITDDETAEKIAQEIQIRYFQNYAGIIYISDVDVVRGKKFLVP